MKYSKVIGSNTDFLTAQAFVFPRIIPEDTTDQLMIAALVVASGEDAFTQVRFHAPMMEEVFFEDSETPIPKRLEEIKRKLLEELSGLDVVHILLVAWNKELMYLASKGDNQAILLRGGKTFPLIEKGKELLSGYVKSGDRILLLSALSFESETESIPVWDEQTIDSLIKTPVDRFEEEAPTTFHQTEIKMPFSLILLTSNDESSPIENLEEKIIKESRLIGILAGFFSFIRSLRAGIRWAIKKLISSKKLFGIVIVICLGLLIVGGIGIKNYQKAQYQKNEVTRLLKEASNLLAQASEQKGRDEMESVGLSIANAKTKVKKSLELDPENASAKALQAEIDQKSDQLLGVFTIHDWPVFLSLDLIKKDFTTTQMANSVNQIVLLDQKQKTLVSVNLETKNVQILAGPLQLGNARIASINGDVGFAYSDDKGLQSINLLSKKITAVAKSDSGMGHISDIFGFGGSIYLLDSSQGQIWKYAPIKTGFSEKLSYLKGDAKHDFIGSKQLFIDYSVWVLKEEGQIIRFTGGVEDAFSIGGLEEPLKDVKRIFVSEDEDKAYLLDPDNSRIVIVKKNGPYLYQLQGDKFKTADDFIIDDEKKVMYLLEGGVIYQVPLPQ